MPSSHISRTQSELQLCKDIATAEYHDNMMFDRLVRGIKDKQARRLQRRNNKSSYTDTSYNTSDRRIERSLESIVRHRYEHIPYVSSPFEDTLDNSYDFMEPDDDPLVFDMDDI